MIKLKLPEMLASFESVQSLPGLSGLRLDPSFGLVGIDPQKSLYVVRAESVDDLKGRQQLSPEILGQYGEVRISGI